MSNLLINKTYLIISKWCYPFGGGEEFLFQSMKWACDMGMKSYWLSFTDSQNKNFTELSIDEYPFGKILKIPGGINKTNIYNWIKIINPDIVHHQGHMREIFFNECKKLRIEFLTGFHFWSGSIILDPEKKNIEILKNYKHHKTDPQIEKLWNEPFCNYYTVTPFVSECIDMVTGYKIKDNIFAASDYNKIKIKNNFDSYKNKYVTMINIHRLKGGEVFLHLLKNLKDIPFLAVRTEHYSEDLDQSIEDEINSRDDGSIFMQRTSNPVVIYEKTKIILVCSYVDETFCRVVNEAMLNGIPVITTGRGNIKYLVESSGTIVDPYDLDGWVSAVSELYFDEKKYREIQKKTLAEYENFSERKAIKQFKKICTKIIKKSKENNIMLFTPWCDQGLGIQSRNYAKILLDHDFNVSVFSLKPYSGDSAIAMQKNPEEWYMENIYYSNNEREKVQDAELIKFVEKYNVGKCIIPETCWHRVFEVARLLRKLNVKCYAVPNIEIVRKDEISKHKYFYKILCNNYLCYNIFKKYGYSTIEYVGYGIDEKNISFSPTEYTGECIKFLFIGGMNAFSRKHIISICRAFSEACKTNDNIHLTCTIQKTNLLELKDRNEINVFLNHPHITFIQEHLPYSKIIELYHENHISIQVSKHEGLGLGFYEGITTGTPVISLDTPPHNEIIINGVNGWLVECYHKKMVDNNDPLFDSAYFDPDKLTAVISSISNDFENVYQNILKTLKKDFYSRLHISEFKKKFLRSLG